MTTSPEIALALEHHREFNANPDRWARLEMIQFTPQVRIVRLDYGDIFNIEGRRRIKQRAICTRHYSLDSNGKVWWYDTPHA